MSVRSVLSMLSKLDGVRRAGSTALVFLPLALSVGCQDAAEVGGPARSEEGYFTFARCPRFEPSGVAALADGRRFLVVSDKKDMAHMTVFRLDPRLLRKGAAQAGRMGLVEQCSFGIEANKLEGVTASRRDRGTFYVTTAFDRPGKHDSCLTRIKLDARGQIIEKKVIPLFLPVDAVKSHLGHAWSKTEALALSADEKRLFLGVRAVGPDFKSPAFRVVVLSYDLARPSAKPALALDIDLSGKSLLGRSEGISGLEYAPELGSFLLLTSYEGRDIKVPRDQVGGHLWVVPSDPSTVNDEAKWESLRRVELGHKPEGVTPIPGTPGKALVVFDDDDDRKSPTGAGGCFKLSRNEGVFTLVDLPR